MTAFSSFKKPIIIAVSIIIFILGGYFIWQHFKQQPVTGESQKQAETPQGIEQAAHNAQVKMYQEQLEDAAKQIASLKNKPPDTIIKTVPVEVVKTIEIEREKRGADFTIVTDPKEPDKTVNLKEIEKLPESTSISLNQYNVFAYKKIIRGVNIYPKFEGIKAIGVSEVTIDVSRKISNDGKYIGIVGGYDFDNKKGKAGIRLTF